MDDNKIAWYQNLGNGSFGAEQILNNQAINANQVIAADLDGDTDLDVISASLGNNRISWYQNLGNGSFSNEQLISDSVAYAFSVQAADLDGDGDNDLVATSQSQAKVLWFENLGGNFGPVQVISDTYSFPGDIALGDMDNDGDNDVVVGSHILPNSEIVWFENQGAAGFGAMQTIATGVTSCFTVFLKDINNDDLPEVFYGDGQADRIRWVQNQGGGSFGNVQTLPGTADMPRDIVLEDMDLDGQPDLVAALFSFNNVVWYRNTGGAFELQPEITTGTLGPSDIELGDYDGDGDLDVITTTPQVASQKSIVQIENLGNGTFGVAREIVTNSKRAGEVEMADADGDGDLDLFLRTFSQYGWYENMGAGNYGTYHNIVTNFNLGLSLLRVADLNGDGLVDCLTSNSSDDEIGYYPNLGGGSFGTFQFIDPNIDAPRSLETADLDNDGDLDVLYSSSNSGNIGWYENQGSGNFSAVQHIPLINGVIPYHAFAADLDGDGLKEIVFGNTNSFNAGTAVAFKNLGNGNFGAVSSLTAGLMHSINDRMEAGDVDGDGDLDLIAVQPQPNQDLFWLENLGNLAFGGPNLITTESLGNQFFQLGDLDQDGDHELLVASSNFAGVVLFDNRTNNTIQVRGELYIDQNQNGVRDSLEAGFPLTQVTSTPQSDFTYTSANGNFLMNFSLFNGVSYQIFPQDVPHWSIVSDSLSYTVQVDSLFTPIDSLDFGFYPDSLIYDLSSSLVGAGARCNDTVNFWVEVRNLGTVRAPSQLSLTLDDSLVFVNADFVPDSIIGQTIYWTSDTIEYFSQTQFRIEVGMPDFNSIGDTISSVFSAVMLDDAGNIAVQVSDTLTSISTCAYDPNDKLVMPSGIGSPGYILPSDSTLEYTVRFQNTGNDTAINVTITDQLDSNLDWSSLTPISNSHPAQISVDPNGMATFQFDQIMLPDSNVNFNASQGFIKYQINVVGGRPIGTLIQNTANIFFDLNPAVVTNTTTNTLYECPTELNFTLNSTSFCEGDSLVGAASDLISSTNFVWEIPGIVQDSSTTLEVLLDSYGSFDLHLSSSNALCALDTLVSLTVYPSYQQIDSLSICAGDSILLFNQYQTQTGWYSDTLTTLNGCDSIASTYLLVNPVWEMFDTLLICAGDSFVIFNQYQNQTGLYTDTLTTENGCDSILSMYLVVLPALEATDTVTICEGDSVQIFGNYETAPGIYYDTVSSVASCDSFLTVQLEVRERPVVQIDDFGDSLCIHEMPITLPNASPAGGIYSGPGVTGNVLDVAFDAAIIVNYEYTDAFGLHQ